MKNYCLMEKINWKIIFCNWINSNYSKFKKGNLIYVPTDEFEFYKFIIKLRNKIFCISIWDTSEQGVYQAFKRNFKRNIDIFLMFYDALERESFQRSKLYFKNKKQNFGLQIQYLY